MAAILFTKHKVNSDSSRRRWTTESPLAIDGRGGERKRLLCEKSFVLPLMMISDASILSFVRLCRCTALTDPWRRITWNSEHNMKSICFAFIRMHTKAQRPFHFECLLISGPWESNQNYLFLSTDRKNCGTCAILFELTHIYHRNKIEAIRRQFS